MIVIAHDIRSLHNVGAIFRSADAFGAEKIYLTGITGTPPRKEIAKVALGSEHRIPWLHEDSVFTVIEQLKLEGYAVYAIETGEDAEDIRTMKPDSKIAILVGNEVEGLSEEVLAMCEKKLIIEMPGRKQSLNVSVATGIALFSLSKK
jgi:23S rRNA (guanosine2251-2'-O)-methyltransferase